jgi:hypothetical protein
MKLQTVVSKTRLRLRDSLMRAKGTFTKPDTLSASDNVFHCCLQKTGSQWVKRILADPDVYRATGLSTYQYQAEMPESHDPRPVNERSFTVPFPMRKIVSPLYIDYGNYRAIPKPESARAFFVTRDPRDLVVSWYFSQRFSHGLMGDIGEVRGVLGDLPQSEGLSYAIRHLDEFGLFAAQRSWLDAADDPDAIVVRFEELIGEDSFGAYRRIFDHCRLQVDDETLAEVLERYSFERLSGRSRGSEDVYTHFRKGVAGDWENHFDDEVMATFREVTGDLVEALEAH